MKKILNKLLRIELVSSTLLTGISSIVKVITVFVVQKIVAVQIGAHGIAILSQMQNFFSISSVIAGLGTNKGIVKYISEFNEVDDNKTKAVVSTSMILTILSSIIVSFFVIFFSTEFSYYLFKTNEYSDVIKVFGVSISFLTLYTQFNSYINGFRQVKLFTKSSIVGNIFSLIVSAFMAYYFGIKGALLSIGITQIVLFLVTIVMVRDSKWFSISYLYNGFDLEIGKKLLNFSFFAFATFIIAPYMEILVRDEITESLNLSDAGIWDGLKKISQGYFSIISLSISFYFLPKFSSLKNKIQVLFEFKQAMFILSIPFMIFLFGVYILRDNIILLLFSNNMMSMSVLFLPFLLGDFFRFLTFLLTSFLTSKVMMKTLLIIQIVFPIIHYVLVTILIDDYGLIGVSYSYFVRTFLRFLVTIYVVYLVVKKMD